MITLLNFGDSPFIFLFTLVGVIFGLVVIANLIALLMRVMIDRSTQKIVAAQNQKEMKN